MRMLKIQVNAMKALLLILDNVKKIIFIALRDMHIHIVTSLLQLPSS